MKRHFSAARPQTAKPNGKVIQWNKEDKKEQKPRPEWNDNFSITENPHKISQVEVLQRKLNAKSKNEQAAREELQQKYEKLKQGKIPKEYKPFTNKGEKKFVANEVFIQNKELKREYQNRSYASQRMRDIQQETLNLSPQMEQIEEEIQVRRETQEVKITYAQNLVSTAVPKTLANNISTTQIPQTSSSQQDISQDLKSLLINDSKAINTSSYQIQWPQEQKENDSTSFLAQLLRQKEFGEPNHGMQRLNSEIIQPLPLSIFTNQTLQEQQKQPQYGHQQPEERQDEYDYLDYKENEARLEKLRNQNLSLYSNFLGPSESNNLKPQPQNIPLTSQNLLQVQMNNNPSAQGSVDDLDKCFQNLNLLLGGPSAQKPQIFETQSNCQITPIKHAQSMTDSPKSLLPNYQELFNFPSSRFDEKPQQNTQPFDYMRAPLNQDYEPQFSQQKQLQNPRDILSGMSQQPPLYQQQPTPIAFNSYQQQQPIQFVSQQPQQIKPVQLQQPLPQQIPVTNKAPQFYSLAQPQALNQDFQSQSYQPSLKQEEEEDQEFARMRDMLLSTQQEIDKIIQGTQSVVSIYNSSKQSTQQPSQSGVSVMRTGMNVPINYQENTNMTMNSMQSMMEEEKPRAYPLQSQQKMGQAYQMKAPAFYDANSIKQMEWQIYKALGVHQHQNNVREHFYCIKEIFELYNSKDLLEKLAARPDLDTVCAFDYHKLKTHALEGEGLRYEDYHPELRGIKIPQLCMDLHLKKLQEIKSKNKKQEIKKIDDQLERKHQEKIRNFEFQKQEKDIEVNRNNKKLLEKLVEISKGKHVRNSRQSFQLSVEALTPVNHNLSQSSLFRPKSLNIVARKKESQKIEEENFKFAKKLFESQGLLSIKEMKQEFKEHVKVMKNVRKVKNKKKNERHGLLPPINANSTQKTTTRDGHAFSDMKNKGLTQSEVVQSQPLNEADKENTQAPAEQPQVPTNNENQSNANQQQESPENKQGELLIKTSTWVRDSHELFDYESPNLMKKSFKIQHSSALLREDTDVQLIGDKEINEKVLGLMVPHDQELKQKPIVYICQSKGYYSLFDQSHKIQNRSKKPILMKPFHRQATQDDHRTKQTSDHLQDQEDSDQNKLWFIVRYMTVQDKTNEFVLTGGETIKLGRVKFTIREIQVSEDGGDGNQTDYDSFENNFLLQGDANDPQPDNRIDLAALNDPNYNREDSEPNLNYPSSIRIGSGLGGVRARQAGLIHQESIHNNGSSFERYQEEDEEEGDQVFFGDYEEEKKHEILANRQTRALDRQQNQQRIRRLQPSSDICIGQQRFNTKDLINNPEEEHNIEDNHDFQFSELVKDDLNLLQYDDESFATEKDCEELQKTIKTKKEQDQDDQDLCRICFSEQQTDQNPLISPCKCSGSLKYVHLDCLRTWLSRKENVKTNPFVTSYSWRAFHCELCKSEYNEKLLYNGRQFSIFEISKPKNNFVILESVQMTTTQGQNHYNNNTKTLHILNLNQKNSIKIGRGHDNDLRIADISVSRCHAFIKKDPKGRIILEDNQSKFGTLVQIKAPLLMTEQLTYYIQAGRTIMKVHVQPEWSILGGIMRTGSKKHENLNEATDVNNPNSNRTGDIFYDYVGKFCNKDAQLDHTMLLGLNMQPSISDEGENVNDVSIEQANIPEEQSESIKGTLLQRNNTDISKDQHNKIQEIKTNQFKIKLTTLKDQYASNTYNSQSVRDKTYGGPNPQVQEQFQMYKNNPKVMRQSMKTSIRQSMSNEDLGLPRHNKKCKEIALEYKNFRSANQSQHRSRIFQVIESPRHESQVQDELSMHSGNLNTPQRKGPKFDFQPKSIKNTISQTAKKVVKTQSSPKNVNKTPGPKHQRVQSLIQIKQHVNPNQRKSQVTQKTQEINNELISNEFALAQESQIPSTQRVNTGDYVSNDAYQSNPPSLPHQTVMRTSAASIRTNSKLAQNNPTRNNTFSPKLTEGSRQKVQPQTKKIKVGHAPAKQLSKQ